MKVSVENKSSLKSLVFLLVSSDGENKNQSYALEKILSGLGSRYLVFPLQELPWGSRAPSSNLQLLLASLVNNFEMVGGLKWVCPLNLRNHMDWWFDFRFINLKKSIWHSLFVAVIWKIWLIRNDSTFNHSTLDCSEIVGSIKILSAFWLKATGLKEDFNINSYLFCIHGFCNWVLSLISSVLLGSVWLVSCQSHPC